MTPMRRSTGLPGREQMLLVQGIYERNRAVIYKYAKARTRSETEADDVVSETLLRLFRNADTLKGLCEKEIVDYMVQTVFSAAADLGRRQRAERKRFRGLDEAEMAFWAVEPDLEERFAEREEEQERYRRLWETLTELRETDRLLLVGKYLEERSDEDLARQLGVKASSIRMKLTRARGRARRIMEGKEAGNDRTQSRAQR